MTTSDIGRRIARLQGRRTFMVDTCSALDRDVGIARARQEYREEVDQILDALEARFHARSLGALEGLLSAFMEDVLPREDNTRAGSNPQPQSVSLQMETQRGLPALQIGVRNGEHLEDALHGRGGSVSNVLSVGLRFAALSRAGRSPLSGFTFRPFLILDEADCWIRHERIAAFSEVIYQLAKDMGIQILMISHHSADMLKGFPVRLERRWESTESPSSPASLRVRYVPLQDTEDWGAPVLPTASEEGETENGRSRGFQAIRLLNFMSHSDSAIPLHPGVTVLTGDNDVGKSAVTEAFRAICYNEASDTVIRHGEEQSEVVLTLEDGQTLHWVRVRKGAPKTRYMLKDGNGNILRETPSPKSVPDWAKNLLGVDLLSAAEKDALDVQIGDQKSPIFLLDRTPSQRAAILDMGRESQHLRRLRDQWKKQVDADRRTIREGEKKRAEIQKSLKVMEDLGNLEEESLLYGQVQEKTQARLERVRGGETILRKMVHAQSVLRVIKALPERVALPPATLWSQIADKERQMRSAERQQQQATVWRRWSKPFQGSMETVQGATRVLMQRAEKVQGLSGIVHAARKWQTWKAPQSSVLPSLGSIHAKEALAASSHSLWSAKQVWGRTSTWKSADLSEVRRKTERVFQGYRMGSDAQHLRKDIQEAEISLRDERKAQAELQKTQAEWLAQWGLCPFCGADGLHPGPADGAEGLHPAPQHGAAKGKNIHEKHAHVTGTGRVA